LRCCECPTEIQDSIDDVDAEQEAPLNDATIQQLASRSNSPGASATKRICHCAVEKQLWPTPLPAPTCDIVQCTRRDDRHTG